MKVLLDEKGYVSSFAIEGELVGGLDLPEPEDMALFFEHFDAYKVQSDRLFFDESQLATLNEESEKDTLRQRRRTECFPFVNRGQLWYATLTVKQIAELTVWYTAWLKVTETKVVPEKPTWLE